eukprot:TRINITY_DN49973_c0_g1_i1.p1 TRINITY_DN49973_c0_g1~~TRINITY_DN49973_c0_g1_i1.p1  ORF type:complete len:390 (+),score=42.30 TRINITY_DN49973_c0_g1_i1:81-1250(+)
MGRAWAGALSVGAVVAGLLWPPQAEAKGSAAGSRSGSYSGRALGGGTHLGSNRAFLYGAMIARPYHVGGRAYSPAYGSYQYAPGFSGGVNGTCGNGTCPCPVPDEAKTKVWVWVQVKLPKALCNGGSCTDQEPYDVTTFEVDAFLDIASRVPCTPPTQVLALKLCKLTDLALVQGGLDDDQLLNAATCTTVGDEVSVHYQARARRLLQTGEYHVLQFVVGAETKAHGDSLHPHVKAALSTTSQLGQVYNLTSDAVLSVETQSSISEFPVWAIVVIVIGGLICLCVCGVFWCVMGSDIKHACCDKDSDAEPPRGNEGNFQAGEPVAGYPISYNAPAVSYPHKDGSEQPGLTDSAQGDLPAAHTPPRGHTPEPLVGEPIPANGVREPDREV